MRKVEKPWGYELIWAETESYVGKLLHINSECRLSKQYHQLKEETVYVINGTLYNYEDDGTITRVNKGESFHVNVGQIHRFGAGKQDVEIIEVSTPHLQDVVRLEDDYERK
jgi:mannose-6-phosphate isomerase|tara:strand:- start:76 stop:408 length:333 start_codon:yes stop_codon:yes gene_type:complete